MNNISFDYYNCNKTLYGCCPNGVNAKLNESGTNCDELSGLNLPPWMMLIIMCLVIAILFILIGITNKFTQGKNKNNNSFHIIFNAYYIIHICFI